MLVGSGFRYGDVLALAENALFAARQAAVSVEMSR